MAAEKQITVRSRVRRNGELVSVDALSPAERAKLAAWLKVTWLNAQFGGRVRFDTFS